MLFNSFVSLIFCLVFLSITERRVLKSPAIIVQLFFYPLFDQIWLMYFRALLLDVYITTTPSWWIDLCILLLCPSLCLIKILVLKSILSSLFLVTIWMGYLFLSFFFNLFMSLSLKWVFTTGDHIVGSWYFTYSANPSFLIGELNSFAFNSYKDGLNSVILVFVLYVISFLFFNSLITVFFCIE